MVSVGIFFSASLRVLLFYICFCSLLINTRLVFISYFVSVPLRKDHRGLECSFVRFYLFLFSFLVICIETFCMFDYLYRDFWFFLDFFYNITSIACEHWSPVWYSGLGLSEKQQRKIIYQRYSIQVWLNIRPNYNYLHEMLYIYIYIYIYIYVRKNKWEVSAKTAIKQGLTVEGVRKRRCSIGNWETLMGLYWGFEGGGGAH